MSRLMPAAVRQGGDIDLRPSDQDLLCLLVTARPRGTPILFQAHFHEARHRGRCAVGSFWSCPVFVAHHLSASGVAVDLAGLEAVDAPARFRLMLLQLPRLPLSFWSVSLFDQR